MTITYSDGEAIEEKILNIVNGSEELDSESHLGFEYYSEWPIRYHLCPERANHLRHLNFQGLDILELGAGMGAVSRFLCEEARTLTVVEGTEQRFSVLASRLRDRENWEGIVANIQDVQLKSTFDVVCLIGVLEYAELYIETGETSDLAPFSALIAKALSFLKPDGVIIMSLENQLGMKYWSGATEDHSGLLFDNICGYSSGKTPKTFSRKQILELLTLSGLVCVDEYYPFPDYKLTHSVLSRTFVDRFPELSADIAVSHPFECYGQPREKLFPDLLAAKTLSKAGLLAEFSNSFLFLGSFSVDSPTREKLLHRQTKKGEMAWYYSRQRKFPTLTVFRADEEGDSLIVSKLNRTGLPLDEKRFQGSYGTYLWCPTLDEPLTPGVQLPYLLHREAYFGQWDAFFNILEGFISWSMERWAIPASDDQEGYLLSGTALDAVFLNAVKNPTSATARGAQPEFAMFDLEWRMVEPFPRSWFIFRNVLGFVRTPEFFGQTCPFSSLYHLYLTLCSRLSIVPNFEQDIAREAEFYRLAVAARKMATESYLKHLRYLFMKTFGESFPRTPAKAQRASSGFARACDKVKSKSLSILFKWRRL